MKTGKEVRLVNQGDMDTEKTEIREKQQYWKSRDTGKAAILEKQGY